MQRLIISYAGEAVIDDGRLTGKIHVKTKAFDIFGERILKNTLTAVEKSGTVCHPGLLEGIYTLNCCDPIKTIPNGVYQRKKLTGRRSI